MSPISVSRLFVFVVSGLFFLTNPGATLASFVNHGTFAGDNVTFGDVTEDNLEPVSFYDMFQVAGDTLIFDPDGFGLQVDPGPGVEFVDSELEMTIAANPGHRIEKVTVTEEGDYTIVASGEVNASAAYFWQVTEVDGQGILPFSGNGTASFASTIDVTGGLWAVDFTIDLVGELAAAELDRGQEIGDDVTNVSFRFDNTLTAEAADPLSIAFIKKKQTGGVQVSVTVPEPSGMLPLLLGAAGLLVRRRRK